MSIAEILSLRFEYEEIVANFVIPDQRKNGVLDNMIWFRKYGNKKNRFRPGYDRAVEIANKIYKSA
tara:strand:- start:2358 stop:2555 length:198 start_codon:yes stop_codon:yes gene_type:complete